jgi:hypothetical protein
MERTEQLEREADQARAQLAGTLDELQQRLTPGQIVDQFTDYAREGPPADFLRNLAREIRENPLPVLFIGFGMAWLIIGSSRRAQRRAVAEARGDLEPAVPAAKVSPPGPVVVEKLPEPRASATTPVGA